MNYLQNIFLNHLGLGGLRPTAAKTLAGSGYDQSASRFSEAMKLFPDLGLCICESMKFNLSFLSQNSFHIYDLHNFVENFIMLFKRQYFLGEKLTTLRT